MRYFNFDIIDILTAPDFDVQNEIRRMCFICIAGS